MQRATLRPITGIVVLFAVGAAWGCSADETPKDQGGQGGNYAAGGAEGTGGRGGSSGNPGGGSTGGAGAGGAAAGALGGSAGSSGAGGTAGDAGLQEADGGNADGGADARRVSSDAPSDARRPEDDGALGVDAGVAPVPFDPALLRTCVEVKPTLIKCTIDVPANGNYRVTVSLGSETSATKSRLLVEEHRITVPTTSRSAGQFIDTTFDVNVRTEIHDGYGSEIDGGPPGKQLDLLIDNGGSDSDMAVPRVHGIGFEPAPNIPTIFVAGDSTVCDWDPVYAATKAGPLERGWAQEFSQYLKPGIAVANYADSGESASSFYNSRFWKPAKPLIREGDYVFIEFAHNDQKVFTLDEFKANMLKYVTDARAAKATPVLFTPISRQRRESFEGFDGVTRTLAAEQNVALVDLTMLTGAYYDTLGESASKLFAVPSEDTHLGEYGATQVAGLVTEYLKTTNLPLRTYLK